MVQDNDISVQWRKPFLLAGLRVEYRVSVHLGHVVWVHNVSTTSFTYHPMDNGIYTIKVISFNGTVTSEAAHTTVTYCTCMFD